MTYEQCERERERREKEQWLRTMFDGTMTYLMERTFLKTGAKVEDQSVDFSSYGAKMKTIN